MEYLTDAAQAGNQYAQYTLGKLYLTGEDVTQDREQAYRWFWESALQGNEYAQFFLDHINDNRSPNVLLSATRLLHHMGRIFRTTPFRLARRAVKERTVNCSRRSARKRSPWATSRMTMRRSRPWAA